MAKIIGVEMDRENFHLAKMNTASYKNVMIRHNAVWIENEIVKYNTNADVDAFAIGGPSGDSKYMQQVEGVTIRRLLQEYKIQAVDYLKMDIEGAENSIFSHHDISWLNNVKSFNIELHNIPIAKVEEYLEMFRSYGFVAKKDNNHWSAILAFRDL